jgi:hypothetical protein
MNAYKPLAQDRLDDYQLYREWEQTRAATTEPEVALEKIRAVISNLKAKGTLAFRLADEEAKLAAEVAERAAKREAREKELAAAESPHWQQARKKARKQIAAYQFEKAVGTLEKVRLKSTSLQAERDEDLQRVRWLVDWRRKLIDDINGGGFSGVVTDIHGVRYDGPVLRATAKKFELKTRYGTVLTDWLNLSPQMLLKISTAFIRPGVPDIAERQWLSAIFAFETEQIDAANDLASKAAGANPQFRDLRARFLPSVKK